MNCKCLIPKCESEICAIWKGEGENEQDEIHLFFFHNIAAKTIFSNYIFFENDFRKNTTHFHKLNINFTNIIIYSMDCISGMLNKRI